MPKSKLTDPEIESGKSSKKKKDPLPKLVHPEQDENAMKHLHVSLVAFFDTARKLKDETGAIKLRITHNRAFKLYSTGVIVTEEEYKNICSHRPRLDMREKRKYVFSYLKRAHDIITELDEFSFDAFDKKYKSKRKSNNIIFYFDNYIEQLKQENRHGSAEVYTNTKLKLIAFAKDDAITFDDIDASYLKRFEQWMISTGNSLTTVGYYCRCIRKLYNDAIRDEEVKATKYPFGTAKSGLYTLPQPRNIKKALSQSDLEKIIKYEPADGSSEHYYRDVWVFSYLGNGINIKDICLLRYNDIRGDSIYFDRAKTINTNRKAKPIIISLIEMNKKIIQRWGNPMDNLDNYIFPVIDGTETIEKQRNKIKQFTKLVNKYIKRVAAKIGVEGDITTYTARHSFATAMMRSGIGYAYISQSLGHTNLKTTESYLDSFEDDARRTNTLKLLDFSSTVPKPASKVTTKKKPSRKK